MDIEEIKEQVYLGVAEYITMHKVTLKQMADMLKIEKDELVNNLHKYVSKYQVYQKIVKLLEKE